MKFVAQCCVVSLTVLLAACGGGGDSNPTGVTPGGNNGNPTTPVSTSAVTVSDNVFNPAAIQVAPGTTVRWTWSSDAREHNVRFTDGGSEILAANATFSRAFPTAGTFTYQCTLHSGMTGTVTVR
ncbi:MAG TPA: plastocyanin/azurin family copper-binding protein [Gemmatimonadaceae bacterium]